MTSFFKKTCDWSYEQEYRLFVKTDEKGRYKLPLNYGNFRGSRHLQYMDDDVSKFGTTYDDTIWCSNDEIYKALMEGKAWIESIDGKKLM